MNCPDCGDELSDFTACGCALSRGAGTSMRRMVAKKLARLASEKARAMGGPPPAPEQGKFTPPRPPPPDPTRTPGR